MAIAMAQSGKRILYFPPFDVPPSILEGRFTECSVLQGSCLWAWSADGGATWGAYASASKTCADIAEAHFGGMQASLKMMLDVSRPQDAHDAKEAGDGYDHNAGGAREMLIFGGVYADGVLIEPIRIEIPFSIGVGGNTGSGLFNPYASTDAQGGVWECATAAVAEIWGLPAYYFRCQPGNKDVVLKTYTAKSVASVKVLKLVLPKNRLPSPRPVYSEWNIAFTDEMTLHSANGRFEDAFGPGSEARQGDYIFFPITGRMYEVATATRMLGLMGRSTYTELILSKYENRAVVKESDEVSDFKNELLSLAHYGLGESAKETEEMQAATPDYINLAALEHSRQSLHKMAKIVANPLKANGLNIFQNMYLMSGIAPGVSACTFAFPPEPFLKGISASFWCVLEERSPMRPLLKARDASGNAIFTVGLEGGYCVFACGGKTAKTAEKMPLLAFLYFHASYSQPYGTADFNILRYNEETLATEVLISAHVENIGALAGEFASIELFGGRHLYGFVGARRTAGRIGDAFEPNPDMAEILFFDNCKAPLSPIKFNR